MSIKKMSSKSKASLEALHALFAPAPVYVTEQPQQPEPPTNLDTVILADLGVTSDVPLFRWFKGYDAKGVERIFKFQRGLSLEKWRDSLQKQVLVQVQGPYRSVAQAAAAPRSTTQH